MSARSRRRILALAGLFSLTILLEPGDGAGQQVSLVAGGDIEWSRITKTPDVYLEPARQAEGGWMQVPYLNRETERRFLEGQGRVLETPTTHYIAAIHYDLSFDSKEDEARYPFRNIAPVLRGADIAFANLETPLSDNARHSGAFRTPTAFADGLRWAGIDVVSTANNHALDAEGQGVLDTREALWRAGVGGVGTGRDLADARKPFIVERNGMKVGFLGYAQFVNAGTSAFAQDDRPGVAPMDPYIVEEDIRLLRDQVDYVVVSFHWNIENSQDTHPDARAFAHRIVDAGADVILGHHPHVPRGVEVYKGKVIFYSLGNFIFGHNHDYWMNNYLARLTLTPGGIQEVQVLPISGRANHLSQPMLLDGAEADALLKDVQARTRLLDTSMEIRGNVGIIRP
ncbi:MAG TPA: CapA family protein [Longimicrobiales bacterium]|nr:CapA family protein [Longimicrobiales bacterium]